LAITAISMSKSRTISGACPLVQACNALSLFLIRWLNTQLPQAIHCDMLKYMARAILAEEEGDRGVHTYWARGCAPILTF
jgi:hypothetical protein